MRIWLLALALGCKARAPHGSEAQAFAVRFVEHVHRDHPDARVQVLSEMSVQLEGRPVLDLRNLWHECTTQPDVCDEAMARWQRVMMDEGKAAIGVESLRIALFPSGAFPGKPLLSRPFAGPVAQVLVVDSPDTIATAAPETLTKLGIDESTAWSRARKNMETALAGPIEGQALSDKAPNVHVGNFSDSYGGARLILHERWAGKAAMGPLLAAAPARDLVIWVTNAGERDALAFRWLAQEMSHREPHPISPAVFRWTPSSWVLEDANEAPIQR